MNSLTKEHISGVYVDDNTAYGMFVGSNNIYGNECTLESESEVSFESIGAPVRNYSIIGNMKQDPFIISNNLFDTKAWFNKLQTGPASTEVYNGTATYSGNAITLTASGANCRTTNSTVLNYNIRVPVEPNKTYTISWKSNDQSIKGNVELRQYNGSDSGFTRLLKTHTVNQQDTDHITFIGDTEVNFIIFIVGVATAGDSITYSDIMFTESDVVVPYIEYGGLITPNPIKTSTEVFRNLFDFNTIIQKQGDFIIDKTNQTLSIDNLPSTGAESVFIVAKASDYTNDTIYAHLSYDYPSGYWPSISVSIVYYDMKNNAVITMPNFSEAITMYGRELTYANIDSNVSDDYYIGLKIKVTRATNINITFNRIMFYVGNDQFDYIDPSIIKYYIPILSRGINIMYSNTYSFFSNFVISGSAETVKANLDIDSSGFELSLNGYKLKKDSNSLLITADLDNVKDFAYSLKPNTTYTLSKSIDLNIYVKMYGVLSTGSSVLLCNTGANHYVTFTTPNNFDHVTKVEYGYTPAPAETFNKAKLKMMLEENDECSPFQNPTNTSFEVNLDRPLYLNEKVNVVDKVGTYENKWGSMIFNGTENWLKETHIQHFCAYYHITDMKSNLRENGYCTHYIPQNAPTTSANGITFGANNLLVYIADSKFTTIDEFKAYLAEQYANGTPVTVYYQLANPTVEPLTSSQYRLTHKKGKINMKVDTKLKPLSFNIQYSGRPQSHPFITADGQPFVTADGEVFSTIE